MSITFNILVVITSFATMEFIAWFAHKYVMHGFLWNIHEDHHIRTGKRFEKNDLFALIFAIPSWLFMMFGIMQGDFKLYIGIGILIYGFVYVFIHEVFIHQRFKILSNTKNPYLLALRRAHKVHHKKLDRFDGECFGMLVVPFKFIREARSAGQVK
ncbi:MAG TPA: sterol desaturase family protein [Ignavibacteriaceae bacterium]